MLVLSRKEGERLVIGDNITLVISKIAGNRVTIGIEAPKDVKVTRSELQPDDEAIPVVVKAREWKRGQVSFFTSLVENQLRIVKVSIPAGIVKDPNGDPNPDTQVFVEH